MRPPSKEGHELSPRSKIIATSQVHKMWNSKPSDVEDLVDLYLHRPVAYVMLIISLSLPKFMQPTPNIITLWSLILGWIGAALALEAMVGEILPVSIGSLVGLGGNSFVMLHVASLMMFLSMVCDCADGQLARATGMSSRWGRYIDGVADVLVVISYCCLITTTLLYQRGVWGYLVGVFAGLYLQQAYNFYDKSKTAYTILSRGKDHKDMTSTIDRTQLKNDLAAAKENPNSSLSDIALIKFAIWYAEGLDLDHELKVLNADHGFVDPDERRKTMRLVTLFGSGVQTFLLYSTVLACAYWKNALLAYAIIQSFGFNYIRFRVWQNTRRDKILHQPAFFQTKMIPPSVAIAVSLFFIAQRAFVDIKRAEY